MFYQVIGGCVRWSWIVWPTPGPDPMFSDSMASCSLTMLMDNHGHSSIIFVSFCGRITLILHDHIVTVSLKPVSGLHLLGTKIGHLRWSPGMRCKTDVGPSGFGGSAHGFLWPTGGRLGSGNPPWFTETKPLVNFWRTPGFWGDVDLYWLMVSGCNEFGIFSQKYWECQIIPIDELIFFRGVKKPPSS